MDTENHMMFVPLSRLMIDNSNVRKKYDQDSIASMKASILADGIIQPLAVRPVDPTDKDLGGQLYRVFAGGRRLRSLDELSAEGAIDTNYEVPIIIRDVGDTDASAMSLAENVIRRSMPPADEFRAFKALVDAGETVEGVALRFGQTVNFVRGRLALGNVHPEILADFELGEPDGMSFAAVSAYTATSDQERQLAYYRASPGYARANAHSIRHALRETQLEATKGKAKFIGEELYLTNGGTITEDLFGHGRFWSDIEIVERSLLERIELLRAQYLADGWSFFATTDELQVQRWHVRTIAPVPTENAGKNAEHMDDLSAEIESLGDPDDLDEESREEYEGLVAEYDALEAGAATFTPDQKEDHGVIVDVESNTTFLGAIKPKEGDGGGLSYSRSGDSSVKAEKAPRDPLALTQPLKDKVGLTATAALKKAVANNSHLALALACAMLEPRSTTMGQGKPSRIKVERVYHGPGVTLDTPKKERGVLEAMTALAKSPTEALLNVLADHLAGTIDLSEAWFQSDAVGDELRAKRRGEFLAAFDADPLPDFEPIEWFGSCNRAQIDEAMKEMTGNVASKGKRVDAAREAAEHATTTGWLPKQLRTKAYKLVKPAKPEKGPKAPKKKKPAAE